MITTRIIEEIKRKDNMIRYKSISDETNVEYCFNYFLNVKNQPLEKGTLVNLEKNGIYYNFKSVEKETISTEKFRTKEHTELPNADDYIIKEQDKYLFGMAGNIAYSFFNNAGNTPSGIDEKFMKEHIKAVFKVLKESRKECLGY